MGEPNNEIAAAEASDAEIELSANDLVSLAASSNATERAAQSAGAMSVEAPTAIERKTSAKHSPSGKAAHAMSRNSIVVGLMFLAFGTGIAVYAHTQRVPGTPMQYTWKPAFPRPSVETVAPEQAASQPQAVPVRYANPFDASEVFEFPPGTSRAAARAAVAEILLQRAAEREPSAS